MFKYNHLFFSFLNKKGQVFNKLVLSCDPGRIRTPNPQSRNLIFYPVELLGQYLIYDNLLLTIEEMVFPSA